MFRLYLYAYGRDTPLCASEPILSLAITSASSGVFIALRDDLHVPIGLELTSGRVPYSGLYPETTFPRTSGISRPRNISSPGGILSARNSEPGIFSSNKPLCLT